MQLFRIKNKYLFNSVEPEKYHTYAVYKDERTNEVRAVQMTHLYRKDEKRFEQLNKGLIKKFKFDEFETPSGVKNYYFATDIKGKPLDLKNPAVIKRSNKKVPKTMENEIRHFSNRRFIRDNKKGK